MSCFKKNTKTETFIAPEISSLLGDSKFGNLTKRDLVGYYEQFKLITEGQGLLNLGQFMQLLSVFNVG